MTVEVDGETLETTETGFLINQDDWNERVAAVLAEQEGMTLSDRHWDVINFLRDCYFNRGGELPNNRQILKGMQEVWAGQTIDSKTLYDLFPSGPSKQAGRIAGLPESMRKGGY
jgi:tRNA 2-thiouridine synthesizing protein E